MRNYTLARFSPDEFHSSRSNQVACESQGLERKLLPHQSVHMETSMCKWFPIRCPSRILLSLWRTRSRKTSPRCLRNSPYSTSFRHFGIHTRWYLQSPMSYGLNYCLALRPSWIFHKMPI